MKKFNLIIGGISLLVSSLFSQNISVTTGWQLLGATENMEASKFNGDCVDFVWQYNNGWKIYIANGKTYNIPSNITTFNSISKGQGFWVKGNKNCTIDTNSTSNTIDAKSLLAGKTIYLIFLDPDSDDELVKGVFSADATSVTYEVILGGNGGATYSVSTNANVMNLVSTDDRQVVTMTQVTNDYIAAVMKGTDDDGEYTDLVRYYFDEAKARAYFTSGDKVPTKTISSASDWSSVQPIYTDPVGDTALSGLDIVDVKMTQDSNNLYIKLDRAGLNFPSSDYYYNYWVYFRAEGTSFSLENFHDNEGHNYYRIYNGIGYQGGTQVAEVVKTEDTTNTGLVMIVPKSLGVIDSSKKYTVTIFTHGFKSGESDIQGEKEDDTVFAISF